MGRANRGAEELFYGEEVAGEEVFLEKDGDRDQKLFDDLGTLLQQDLRNPRGGEIDEQFGIFLVSKDRNFNLHRVGITDKHIEVDLAEDETGFVLEVSFIEYSEDIRDNVRDVVYSGSSVDGAARAARNIASREGITEWGQFNGDWVRKKIETVLKNYS